MNRVYPLTTEKSWKSALIEADRLLLINSSQADAEKFMSAYEATGVKSWLSSKKEIHVQHIISMVHKETKPLSLRLKHGSKKETLNFAKTEDLEAFVHTLSAINKLQPDIKRMSKLKAVGGWLIGLGFTGLFGWMMHGFATGTLSYSTSGRRSGLSKLLYNLAQKMGAELVLIVTLTMATFITYKIYHNARNPPNEVVYE
jgi:hypothetical protein